MSNLLKDASILLTPTAYENGRMNAIKPYKDLYGPELVTNGDFSNGSTGWTISGSASVGVNKLNVNAGAFDFFATQVALTNGLKCKVTIDAEVTSGDILLYTGTQFATISSSGSYTFYTTSDSSQIRFRSGGSGFVGSITNVSVKEDLSGDFQFSRNSAATRVNAQGLVENVQIISSELVSNGNFSQIGTEEVSNGNFSQEGSELITNGDFATDTNWTLSSGITYNSNGYIDFDGTQGAGQARNTPNITFVQGKTYKVVYEIKNYVSGNIKFRFQTGTNTIGQQVNGDGVKTEYIVCNDSSNNNFQFFNSPDFIGSIDNVSVKEVGQDWDLGTGWSIGDDKVEADGTSAFLIQGEFQSVASVKSYKIQYEVLSTNGVNIRFGGGSSMFGTPTLDTATIGIKTIYLQSNGTVRNLQFQNNLGFNGSITNISVKEVGQDWAFVGDFETDGTKAFITSASQYSQLTNQIGVNYLLSGRKYRLSLDIPTLSISRAFAYRYTGGSVIPIASSDIQDGKFTTEFTMPSNGYFWLQTTGSYTGLNVEVDNISVKEITDDTDLPRINYEGFSYQDSLGSEEVVNGDFATDSNWSLGNWTIENNTVTIDGQSGILSQATPPLVAGKKYKWTFEITEYISGSVKLYSGGGGDAATYENSVGTHTQYFVANGTGKYFYSNSFNGSIDNVSVKEYLGQEVVPDSGCGSWLLEPQSTNITPYSEDFTQSWTPTGLTITSNSIASPSGEINSDKWVEDTSNGAHSIRNNPNIPVTSGNNYTMSIFAKAGERTGLRFANAAESNAEGRFDLSNGTVTFTGANTTFVGIEDYGNGWYRCIISFTASATIVQLNLRLMDGSSLSYQGNGTSGLYAWGAMLEQQSYATSYIPTNGATNTRLQDIANNSGNSTLINSTEGVLYAEIAAFENDASNRL